MTSNELQNFKNCLNNNLKAIQNGKSFVVKEQEERSVIQEINFQFDQRDDALIIQQDIRNCPSITNLFGNDGDRIESCDFIVLLIKNKELKIFFCEIKSINNKENREKAKRQIESSKIFFKYLYKSYLHKYNKNVDFSTAIENAKSLILYPAPMSQKKPTYSSEDHLIPFPIKLDNNGKCVLNGYKFFQSRV